jgi:electron transfer flavoprotein alpha subunit
MMIGQTGKTVKPAVYLAVGISGATQHVVAIQDAKYIVAINQDRNAPIFQIADLGVVADALEVLPALLDLLGDQSSCRTPIQASAPPSIGNTAPVMNAASSEAR